MTKKYPSDDRCREAALAYINAGLSVLPTSQDKIPIIKEWKSRTSQIPAEDTVNAEFENGCCVAIVSGKISGNLECIDFDFKARLFIEWQNLVNEAATGLIDKLVVQETQSGGKHVVYRCQDAVIDGNQKLASELIKVKGPGENTYFGKTIKSVQRNGQHYITPCFIETRGEGGYFLSFPSPGYSIVQGRFSQVPTISKDERDILIQAARALNRDIPDPGPGPKAKRSYDGLSPGDDYNLRGDIPALLTKHGWAATGRTAPDGEQWRRPGKDKGWSATLFNSNNLYVFTSNAPPFEQDTSYSPLAIYTLLEHSNDYTAAIKELASQGYGKQKRQKTKSDKQKADKKHTESCPDDPENKPSLNKKPKKEDTSYFDKIDGTDAVTLMKYDFPEPRWVVPGIIPEGTLIFAGKPKAGKSVWALNLCLAVSLGGKFLGQDVEKSPVLYLHLEDNQRRIQRRLRSMMPIDEFTGVQAGPSINLQLYYKWPKIGEGGLRALDLFLQSNKAKLIVIDTFKRFYAAIDKNDRRSQYEIDYDRLIPLSELAEKHDTTIMAVMHTRKTDSDDPIDLISGTLGNAGAVDTNIILYNRNGARAQLWVQGRDVEQEGYALEYEPNIWTWQMLGKSGEVMATESQQTVLDYLKELHSESEPASLTDIIDGTGLKRGNLKIRIIPKLLKDAVIIRKKRNQYYAL